MLCVLDYVVRAAYSIVWTNRKAAICVCQFSHKGLTSCGLIEKCYIRGYLVVIRNAMSGRRCSVLYF